MKISMPYRMLALMTGAQVGTAVVQQGLGSLAPVLLRTYHLSEAQLGASFTAISIGSAFFTVLAGVVVDRFGERPVVFWGGLGLGVTLTAAAALPSYPWLVTWLFLFGVMYAAQTPAGGRAILAWFDRDRGFAMSIRQAGVPLGGALGGVILPFVAQVASYRWSLVVGGVLATTSATIAAAFYRDAPRTPGVATKRFGALFAGMVRVARDPRTLAFTLACMVLSSAQTIANAFFAVTAVELAHASPPLVAGAFAVMQLAAVGGRIVWGRLSDGPFRGERALPLAAIGVVVAADVFALAHLRSGAVAWLFVLGTVLGFSGSGWNGVFATGMAELGGAELAGSVLGFGLTFVFLAGAAGPLVFGHIADTRALPAAWTALGWTSLGGVVAALGASPAVVRGLRRLGARRSA